MSLRDARVYFVAVLLLAGYVGESCVVSGVLGETALVVLFILLEFVMCLWFYVYSQGEFRGTYRRHRLAAGLCPECGFDKRLSPVVCPMCGHEEVVP